MKTQQLRGFILLMAFLQSVSGSSEIINGGFEEGGLTGWTGDPNWSADSNTGGWYMGYSGKWFAWSGTTGEKSCGVLKSDIFTLDRDGVEVLMAGWSNRGGQPPARWNYVILRLAGGKELDRAYAPNSLSFVPCRLSGRGHQGEKVYLEAVDDADEEGFSMFCIDEVKTVDMPELKPLPQLPSFDKSQIASLENEKCQVVIDRKNGSILRVLDKQSGLELIREPRLSASFMFSLPLRGEDASLSTEANYIRGTDQNLSSLNQDGSQVTLSWEGPLKSVFGKVYDCSAQMLISLSGEEIKFNLVIDNKSPQEIGEVYFPILGGVVGLGTNDYELRRTQFTVPVGGNVESSEIFTFFNNFSGLGPQGPEQFYSYPDRLPLSWSILHSPELERSCYIAAHDPIFRHKVLHLEMQPGVGSGGVAGGDRATNWPSPEELEGNPAGVLMSFVQMPYSPPRTRFESTPVVVRFIQGGWQEAAEIYRSWLETMNPQQSTTDWLSLDGAVLEKGIHKYSEILKIAEEAKAVGIHSLLLREWRADAENRGIPSLLPDTCLGSEEEFKAALANCRSLGVRVMLHVNLQPVSQLSVVFRSNLNRSTCLDRWGIPRSIFGWSSGTTTSESVASGERRVWLNPSVSPFRESLIGETVHLAEIGVDGLLLENFFPDQPLDFNQEVGTTADRSVYGKGLDTLNDMIQAAREGNKDFVISVDKTADRLVPTVHCSSPQTADPAALKLACPSWNPWVKLGKDDPTKSIHKALLLGGIIRLVTSELAQLDKQQYGATHKYLSDIQSLRTRFKDTLLAGAFKGKDQVMIDRDTEERTFESNISGLKTCVLVNDSNEAIARVFKGFINPKVQKLQILRPQGEPQNASVPCELEIPPQSAVLISEVSPEEGLREQHNP